jgi:hypothetical protein
VNDLSANLRLNGPHQVRSVDGSKTWFDPVAGVQLRTPDTCQRWHAQVYTETGRFGVGSDFIWQVFSTIGVRLTERASRDRQKTDIERDATQRGSWMILKGGMPGRASPLSCVLGARLSGARAAYSADIAVMAATLTISATVMPCCSTFTGLRTPSRMGPSASALPSRCTSL